MTVEELKEKLEEFEDDYDIIVYAPEENDDISSEFSIKKIEEGSSWNVNIYIE